MSKAAIPGLSNAPTRHLGLIHWVGEIAELTQPDRVVWCDGSEAELERLTADLIAAGKQKQLTYSSNNVTNVVAMFQLAKLTGAKLRWVVFPGGVDSVTAAIGGPVDAVIQTVAEMRPQIEANKLRFLASAAEARWPDYPDVKTLRELGFNAVSNGPFGYAFPTGVDPAIKERMDKALADVMADESVRKQITNLGIEAIYRNGKDYAALLKSIETELVPILKETGMAKKPT